MSTTPKPADPKDHTPAKPLESDVTNPKERDKNLDSDGGERQPTEHTNQK